MVAVTKKHQTSMALIAVVLATVMIAGTFAMGNNAFARSAADQSITETCDQNQKSSVTTAGFLSPPIASGNNVDACLNFNFGGNALNQDQSTQN